ncbi:DUF1353 domain-containing protein [Kiloniella sp. b19]|uniref:DUF1353 domain-containing protein n=1 Tax=Kiloniella sp. GXU_MW_B19 TaxID=3141326 RepID=UPI0031D2EF57
MQQQWQIRAEGVQQPGILVRVLNNGAENFVTHVRHEVRGPRDRHFVIPAGFRFDFASIPAAGRWFISRTDARITRAAMVHDWLYDRRLGSRKVADDIFLEIMAEDGMPVIKRRVAWLAVRLGGGRAWRN